MIQRVQTIYMLLAAILVSLTLFFPLASFVDGALSYELNSFGVSTTTAPIELVASTTYMGVLSVIVAVMPLVIIFLYKNRMLQIRLCYFTMVLMFGLQLFIAWYIYQAYSSVLGSDLGVVAYSIVDFLPTLGVLFMWLAVKGVIKDEALVRSLDRIR